MQKRTRMLIGRHGIRRVYVPPEFPLRRMLMIFGCILCFFCYHAHDVDDEGLCIRVLTLSLTVGILCLVVVWGGTRGSNSLPWIIN